MKKNEASFWLFLRKMRTPLIVLNIVHAIPVILLTIIPGIDNEGHSIHLSFFDAMYIVAYTATTIGFGEIPYAFTYAQRLVVFLTIYIAVPAWIYALGSIIALLQDKSFLQTIRMNGFRRRVRNLGQDFILICGYTDATRLLIERLNKNNDYRIVVIDQNSARIEELESELYMPSIPAIAADASMSDVLKASGVQSPHCKFLVTLFEESQLNLKIAVRARSLNKNLKIIARAGIKQGQGNLSTIGVEHVIDVFSIIAQRIDFALRSPYLFNLLSWIQGGNLHVSKSDILPDGKYIVCGRGRFANAVNETLDENGIEYTYLEVGQEIIDKIASNTEYFLEAGVLKASCIIVGTNNDAINLSIIASARTINPNIFVIVRENELEERSLFSHMKVNKIFAPDQISALDAYNYIHRPLTFRFIEQIEKLSNEQFVDTLKLITRKINKRPALLEMAITEKHMYALSQLLHDKTITIGQLLNDPYKDGKDLEIIVLGIEREGGEFILLPESTTSLYGNDRLLFATTQPSLKRFMTIVNNYYELYYVVNGAEEQRFRLWK